MTLKDVCFVLVISVIITNTTCETVTVSRRDDGDRITGDIKCTDHYGTVQSEDNSCVCKGERTGTFFTSCLYEDTAAKTGCALSLAPQNLNEVTYLSSQSDLTGKNILQDNVILQNCTKLEITKTDVWNSTNRWYPFHSVMYVVESSDSSFYQLSWTPRPPDSVLWDEFKGQILRVAMKCTSVLGDKVDVEEPCMLMKINGQKVYKTPVSPDYPYPAPTSPPTPTPTPPTSTPKLTTQPPLVTVAPPTAPPGTTTTAIPESPPPETSEAPVVTITPSLTPSSASKTSLAAPSAALTTPSTNATTGVVLPPSKDEQESDDNIGLVAGAGAGGAILLLLIFIVIILILRKKNMICSRSSGESDNNNGTRKRTAKDIEHNVVLRQPTKPNHYELEKKSDSQTQEADYMEPVNWNQPKEFHIMAKVNPTIKNKPKSKTKVAPIKPPTTTSPTEQTQKTITDDTTVIYNTNTKGATSDRSADIFAGKFKAPLQPKTRNTSTVSYDNPLVDKAEGVAIATGDEDETTINRKISQQPILNNDVLMRFRKDSDSKNNKITDTKKKYEKASTSKQIDDKSSSITKAPKPAPRNSLPRKDNASAADSNIYSNPQSLQRETKTSTMASDNSGWGSDFEDDYPCDTLRGFDNRIPLSSQPSNGYAEYNDNATPPNNQHQEHEEEHSTDSNNRRDSEYQRLQSMRRHTSEAGIYATLTQDF